MLKHLDHLVCPITLELPVHPVLAEDGNIYERDSIEQQLLIRLKSPLTNAPMGQTLQPARHVTNMLLDLICIDEQDERLKTWYAAYQNRTEKFRMPCGLPATKEFESGKHVRTVSSDGVILLYNNGIHTRTEFAASHSAHGKSLIWKQDGSQDGSQDDGSLGLLRREYEAPHVLAGAIDSCIDLKDTNQSSVVELLASHSIIFEFYMREYKVGHPDHGKCEYRKCCIIPEAGPGAREPAHVWKLSKAQRAVIRQRAILLKELYNIHSFTQYGTVWTMHAETIDRIDYKSPHPEAGKTEIYKAMRLDQVIYAAPHCDQGERHFYDGGGRHFKTTYDDSHSNHNMVKFFREKRPAYSVSQVDGKVWIHSRFGQKCFKSSMTERELVKVYDDQDVEEAMLKNTRKRRRDYNRKLGEFSVRLGEFSDTLVFSLRNLLANELEWVHTNNSIDSREDAILDIAVAFGLKGAI